MAFWKNWEIPVVEEGTPYTPKAKVTVEEIHNTFFTEVDRLLAEAKNLNSLESEKQELVSKAERLRKLGFNHTQDVVSAHEEEARLRNLKSENEIKLALSRAIEYFTFKYPQYKFITEAAVKKICEKYGLIYGNVSRYVGAVPDKNLDQIEKFKIDEKDECYESSVTGMGGVGFGTWSPTGFIDPRDGPISMPNGPISMPIEVHKSFVDKEEAKRKRFNTSGSMYTQETVRKCSLEIAAPKSDFNMTQMEVQNFKLQAIPIPDPIVLCPVLFEGAKHYLVVTAWGDESKEVVNEKLN